MSGIHRTERTLWICLLLLVPISASPLLPFGSSTLIRPLSFVPAVLLLILAAIRFLLLKQKPQLPADGSWLLALFVIYVALAGLFESGSIPDDMFKGQTPLGSFIRALSTLFVGVAFFYAARLNIRTREDIRLTIRYLFVGMTASIGLAIVQVAAIVERGETLRVVQTITDLFAVHYDGLVNRAQGMTFEPSWLATQILALMLPALAARLISRRAFSGARVDRRNIKIALAGFVVAIVGLLCAGSRFGLASATLLTLSGSAMALWRRRFGAAMALVAVLLLGGVAFGNLNAGAGATYVLGPIRYLSNASEVGDMRDPANAATITDALALAGRVAAGEAAFDLWRDHPLFGVSFGNEYRYFNRYAPDWAFATQLFTSGAEEGVGWLDSNSPQKGNAKIFFLRLLSETGLIGFILFGTFFLRQLFGSSANDAYFAVFRLTAAIALLLACINQDSFADPALWITLVLCSTMGRLQIIPQEAPAMRDLMPAPA